MVSGKTKPQYHFPEYLPSNKSKDLYQVIDRFTDLSSPLMGFKESLERSTTDNSEVSEQTYWQAWRRLENVITESTEFTC